MFYLSKYFHSAVILSMRPGSCLGSFIIFYLQRHHTQTIWAKVGDCGEEELKTTNNKQDKKQTVEERCQI